MVLWHQSKSIIHIIFSLGKAYQEGALVLRILTGLVSILSSSLLLLLLLLESDEESLFFFPRIFFNIFSESWLCCYDEIRKYSAIRMIRSKLFPIDTYVKKSYWIWISNYSPWWNETFLLETNLDTPEQTWSIYKFAKNIGL